MLALQVPPAVAGAPQSARLPSVEAGTVALRWLCLGLSVGFTRSRKVLSKDQFLHSNRVWYWTLGAGTFALLSPFYRLGSSALRNVIATPVGAGGFQEARLPVR